MNRLPRVAAVIVTLAAAALATTAQGDAHAATAPTTTPPRTHLVLHVTGCDGCFIAAQQAVEGRLHVWTSPTKHVGSDHRVTYDLQDGADRRPVVPRRGAVGGQHGRDLQHGDPLRRPRRGLVRSAVPRRARAAGPRAAGPVRRSTACGSTSTSRGCRARPWTAEPTHLPLAYATHTVSSWKPMVSTFKGTIGNQDAFWCTRP